MQLHASCVALGPGAALIRGASGSGKSALSLQLMAFGARLVADDRTDIALHDGWPFASAPASIRGMIEARGIGLLAAEAQAHARITLVVDMDRIETGRLPPERRTDLLGCAMPLLHKIESPHFAAAILLYLKAGKADH
ncbi:MAG: serine kinase [Rhodobacteraceae bacterium]|nr:serine kinase [Paracoccaceae bacterium]